MNDPTGEGNRERMNDLNQPTSDWRHKLIAVIGLILSTLYLLNLSGGFIELPDNLPLIGNIDEVLVSGVFFACLSQLGINLLPYYRAFQGRRTVSPSSEASFAARLPPQ